MSPPPRVEAGAWAAPRAVKLRLIGLFLLTDAATLALVADWDSPVRVVLVLGFLLLGPGLAVTEALEVRDPARQLALGASVSLAVETLVAVALLYAGGYSVDRAFAIVAGLTMAALAVAGVRAVREPERRLDSDPVGASA